MKWMLDGSIVHAWLSSLPQAEQPKAAGSSLLVQPDAQRLLPARLAVVGARLTKYLALDAIRLAGLPP